MKISLVCHGNIARSQVLHHYLQRELDGRGVSVDLFSFGIAPPEAYPDGQELLRDVQRRLRDRGLDVRVQRTPWSDQACERVKESDLVLVADGTCRRAILDRTGLDEEKVHLFYEFLGEGSRDFTDTFDHDKGRQDPERYTRSFDELARIAHGVAHRIGGCGV